MIKRSVQRRGRGVRVRSAGRRPSSLRWLTRQLSDPYVAEAKAVVAAAVPLPPGYSREWAGTFEQLAETERRLELVLPLTGLLIVLLLFLGTKSWFRVSVILLAVPFSLIGAFWFLWALDYSMSVAVWVGIIALAGLDAETGVVMLLDLTLAFDDRHREGRRRHFEDLRDAIVEGAARRVRPKLMTVLAAMVGLLPIFWTSGTGSDVMKRIAAPMVGGLVTSFLLELTVYPALFAIWKNRQLRFATETP